MTFNLIESTLAGVAQWIGSKGCRFDSGGGTCLGCGWSLVRGVREATDQCFSHTSMFISLSFSLPSPLSKKNKVKKKEETENYKNNQKTINKIAINTYLPIITLNVNAWNVLIKRLRAAE